MGSSASDSFVVLPASSLISISESRSLLRLTRLGRGETVERLHWLVSGVKGSWHIVTVDSRKNAGGYLRIFDEIMTLN